MEYRRGRILGAVDPDTVNASAILINQWDPGTSVAGWSGSVWTPTANWATATGSAMGTPTMYRQSGLSTHMGYMEFDLWYTGTGDGWVMFSMSWGTDAYAYNDNGFAWIVRGPSASTPNIINATYGSGTNYILSPPATSETAYVTIGLEITGTNTSTAYVNNIARASCTHTTNHSARRNVAFGVFNGVTGRIRNVKVWTARPY
ncbi:hypothetical protein KC968_03390 [Candidatus Saccharibacteria bacterium]|nr:hypothetical protein [Candidatus Saccharibacteria bacterium]